MNLDDWYSRKPPCFGFYQIYLFHCNRIYLSRQLVVFYFPYYFSIETDLFSVGFIHFQTRSNMRFGFTYEFRNSLKRVYVVYVNDNLQKLILILIVVHAFFTHRGSLLNIRSKQHMILTS